MRDLCQQVEGALSYVRRLAHGRLDIVGGELARRRAGGDPDDLSELIARLPELLADPTDHAFQVARSPRRMDLGEPPVEFESDLDDIVRASDLTGLSDRSDADLERVADELVDFERKVSDRRRQVHERIDALQAEVARRYKDGEADVGSILA